MKTVSNQKGTGMTEVCCMLALIAIAAAASLGYLGNAVEKKFTDQANLLDRNNNATVSGDGFPAGSGNGNNDHPSNSDFNSSSGPYGGYNNGQGSGVN